MGEFESKRNQQKVGTPPIQQPPFSLVPTSEAFENAVFDVSKPILQLPDDSIDYRTVAQPAFFVLLLAIGATLTFSFDGGVESKVHFSELLVLAGLTPAVLYFWSFCVGYGLRRSQDFLRVVFSVTLMAIGFSIWQGTDLQVMIWHGIFEIGALFFIEKFFFLAADDEKIIKDLKARLDAALRSPGTGMAMSYYYNFVLPTASCMKEDAITIDMEKSRGVFEDYRLHQKTMYVFVPRTLDGTDMKKELSNGTRSGALKMGKPKVPKDGEPHRPMFMYFLAANDESFVCNGMCDFPTIISSCWDREQAMKLSALPQDELPPRSLYQRITNPIGRPEHLSIGHRAQFGRFESTIPREIEDFENELLRLINSDDATKDVVRIVSIPCPPFDFEHLSNTFAKYTAQREDLQTETQHGNSTVKLDLPDYLEVATPDVVDKDETENEHEDESESDPSLKPSSI
eukprot:m.101526 g.101526  ORF g.101526 m.101526 type:complete len:457 (-) comp27333_c0_seq7:111-1481(-)